MRQVAAMVIAAMMLATTAACADAVQPVSGVVAVDGPVTPLAKVEGWRQGPAGDPYGLLEIAFDQATAERAWQDNVPPGLPMVSGDPQLPGRYGDLSAVDFTRQALVVWSSGESSGCPAWLADIRTTGAGVIELQLGAPDQSESDAEVIMVCTSDYRPYRMVLAVDRDRLPQPGDLPLVEVRGVPDALVTAYPAR